MLVNTYKMRLEKVATGFQALENLELTMYQESHSGEYDLE